MYNIPSKSSHSKFVTDKYVARLKSDLSWFVQLVVDL